MGVGRAPKANRSLASIRMAADSPLWEVLDAKLHADHTHGNLKPGPARWSRLITEEYQEVMDELATLQGMDISDPNWVDTKQRAVEELAQLAQLCIGAIELIQQGKAKG